VAYACMYVCVIYVCVLIYVCRAAEDVVNTLLIHVCMHVQVCMYQKHE
jgi:hypothetical protein